MISKEYLTYALNIKGDWMNIDEVPNGNECGCFCPKCKSALCAKNGGDGEKMIHHFAHLSGADCVGAVESALHLMAKNILMETRCVYLPDRYDGRKGEVLRFDRVEVEFYDRETQLRPDCIGYYGEKCLWIEFKRTHEVDAKKRGKIISAHIDCIEIELNGCKLDPIELRKFITDSAENRKWIRDVSISNRRAGRSYNSGYCHRYDSYDDDPPVNRTFSKDEKGRLVNILDDDFDLNEHTYYCLACGKELSVDLDEEGAYRFVHIEDNKNCVDDFYLYKAAKKILFYRFYNTKEFIIEVPQFLTCSEKDTCPFYRKEECIAEKRNSYDLKKHGYEECVKDYMFPNTHFKCDLVIKRADSFDQAIILCIAAGRCHVDVPTMGYRVIQLNVYNEYSLEDLQDKPIGEGDSLFLHFNKNHTGTVPPNEVNRDIKKFQLYSSGKYYLGSVSCSKINNWKRSTVYEIIFEGGIMDYYDSKIYSLLKCYQKQKQTCYCELCFFCTESSSFGMSQTICTRYKTRGTPHYPLKTMPTDCLHFSLNRTLVSYIESKTRDVVVIERTLSDDAPATP